MYAYLYVACLFIDVCVSETYIWKDRGNYVLEASKIYEK
jgi:hypothetical protein